MSEAPNGTLGPEQLVECLLFVADGPVLVAQLAQALDMPPRAVEAALAALEAAYDGRGLRLQRWQDRVQLTTAPAAAAYIERFLGLSATTRLSHAALETLAIVAYQQPVTRPHIDSVRGVNSDSVIKSLLTKGLIEEVGRGEGVGRPILYRTTPEFMQHFGLSSLNELPPLNLPEALALVQAEEAQPDAAEAPGQNGASEIHDALSGEFRKPEPAKAEAVAEPAKDAVQPQEAFSDAGIEDLISAYDEAPSEPPADEPPGPEEAAPPHRPAKPSEPPAWQGDWTPVFDLEDSAETSSC